MQWRVSRKAFRCTTSVATHTTSPTMFTHTMSTTFAPTCNQ